MVNRQVVSLLEQCLASGDARGWLTANPEHRDTLLPYLEMDGALRASASTGGAPRQNGLQEGQRRLLTAVATMGSGTRSPRWVSAPARAVAVLTVAVAAFGLAAGASALTGHDLAGDVLSTLGVSDKADNGINNASPNAEGGREHANGNAFEGSGNADDGPANAANPGENGPLCEPVEHGQDAQSDNANANAAEGSDNAADGFGNASCEAGHAGDHPSDNALDPPSPGDVSSPGPPDGQPTPRAGPR